MPKAPTTLRPFMVKARPQTIANLRQLQAQLQILDPDRKITMDQTIAAAVSSLQASLGDPKMVVALSLPINSVQK